MKNYYLDRKIIIQVYLKKSIGGGLCLVECFNNIHKPQQFGFLLTFIIIFNNGTGKNMFFRYGFVSNGCVNVCVWFVYLLFITTTTKILRPNCPAKHQQFVTVLQVKQEKKLYFDIGHLIQKKKLKQKNKNATRTGRHALGLPHANNFSMKHNYKILFMIKTD